MNAENAAFLSKQEPSNEQESAHSEVYADGNTFTLAGTSSYVLVVTIFVIMQELFVAPREGEC